MRIAKLHIDPQDKTRFEIQGKSSVKYHLKANHDVEAKRWFWALNNAIQWAKDEAKEGERQKQRKEDIVRQARSSKPSHHLETKESGTVDSTKLSAKSLTPAAAIGVPLTASSSRLSFQDSTYGAGSVAGDDDGSMYDSREPSIAGNDIGRSLARPGTTTIAGDPDDDEEYGDDTSSREMQPASRDAFNITAHSASLQLNILSQVSSALQAESRKEEAVPISDSTVVQALSTYESAVSSLQGLVNDLLKISRDRDAYWQYRLDQEADVRRLWEDSMTQVAKEQEELEGRIEESEEKRKRTKRALKDALEGQEGSPAGTPSQNQGISRDEGQVGGAFSKLHLGSRPTVPSRRKSIGIRDQGRRKSTIADLTNLSDSDSDEDEEFFDAVDAGQVEVIDIMPESMLSLPPAKDEESKTPQKSQDLREKKKGDIEPSFHGYEDPIRKRLKMDADDRPTISLWV